ncbi:MAG TPA: hypothetical protein VHV81_00750 [Steroidobacteraceae bacterium]|nr:hypothetical protein [Steroidobacteraceae bacterium]
MTTSSRARAAVSLGAFACILGGCAALQPTRPGAADSAASAQARGVCESVMGLSSRSAQYSDCVASLSGSQDRMAREQALADARGACVARQLSDGSAGLFECEVRSDRAIVPAARREHLACASLGLDPERSDFSACVKQLHEAMVTVHLPPTD